MTVLENCKHAAEGARATRQLHKALRKSKLIEKLLMAVVILTIATITTHAAVAKDHNANRSESYALVR